MKILPSGLISTMAGRLGGSVMRRSASGLVMQRLALPSKGNTAHFINSKSSYSVAKNNFALLSEEEKNRWSQLSVTHPVKDRFGNDVVLSCFAYWLYWNRRFFCVDVYTHMFIDTYNPNAYVNSSYIIEIEDYVMDLDYNYIGSGTHGVLFVYVLPLKNSNEPVNLKRKILVTGCFSSGGSLHPVIDFSSYFTSGINELSVMFYEVGNDFAVKNYWEAYRIYR